MIPEGRALNGREASCTSMGVVGRTTSQSSSPAFVNLLHFAEEGIKVAHQQIGRISWII